jgi:hypothetical protein
MPTYSHIVVGAGGLGTAAAYWLAKSGCRDVLVLEQFELGNGRGASEDHSRIIRHSYHSADYTALTPAAYESWTSSRRRPGCGWSSGPAVRTSRHSARRASTSSRTTAPRCAPPGSRGRTSTPPRCARVIPSGRSRTPSSACTNRTPACSTSNARRAVHARARGERRRGAGRRRGAARARARARPRSATVRRPAGRPPDSRDDVARALSRRRGPRRSSRRSSGGAARLRRAVRRRPVASLPRPRRRRRRRRSGRRAGAPRTRPPDRRRR